MGPIDRKPILATTKDDPQMTVVRSASVNATGKVGEDEAGFMPAAWSAGSRFGSSAGRSQRGRST